jgi:bifunctional non-homologous end joining protein LigD
MPAKQQVTVEGRVLSLTNLDKVLYPAARFTKADVIDYYTRVSKWLLPHLKDHPVTLKRFPDGVGGQAFYEKDAPRFTPDWVQTAAVPRKAGGKDIRYILINDLPTLVWCANLASLELHPFLHLASNLDTPTSVVFDLDPGEGATTATCAEVALILRDALDRLELQSFAKVSGSKGIQIYVPLNTPVSYATTQEFAHSQAQSLEREHPSLIVSEMAKNLRRGKVFIDWSQNSNFKTTISVYSLRAKVERPYVSLPVTWEEVEGLRKEADKLCLEPEAALKRIEKKGDLFAPVLRLKQKLQKKTTASKTLDEYRQKRDFTKTKEPAPAAAPTSNAGKQRRFVIQKHAASHLHYDFRLEMDGVLKSWAVPKGVPFAPKQRRLAAPTEDHPIEYLDFEGTIPRGEYGGGTVMVWDIGTYELIDGSYEEGKLHFRLKGKKLNGEWALVAWGKDRKKWFLLKAGEAAKPVTEAQEDSSALTGRTMEQVANAGATKVRRGSA